MGSLFNFLKICALNIYIIYITDTQTHTHQKQMLRSRRHSTQAWRSTAGQKAKHRECGLEPQIWIWAWEQVAVCVTAEVTFLRVALGKSFSQTSSLCPNTRQVMTGGLVTYRVVMLGGEEVCPEDPASGWQWILLTLPTRVLLAVILFLQNWHKYLLILDFTEMESRQIK